MIPGVTSSNQRVLPFFTTATNLNLSGSATSSGDPAYIHYLNGQYLLKDHIQDDIMTSSSILSGYTDQVTDVAIVGVGGPVSYENGRYFIHDFTNDVIDTSTTLGGTWTAVSTGDLRTPIRWFSPSNAWWAAGDDGNTQTGGGCLLRYSTNGTTWTTVGSTQEPSTLRLLGLATDGSTLIVTSEGATGVPHIMKYTTSTNPASLTWSTITSPFSSTADVGHLYYHPEKSMWTCSSAQAVFAYSSNGTSEWTTKDLGWGDNSYIKVEWVPWHNRWIAFQLSGERQFAYSNTSDIGGTWTLGTQTTGTTVPKGFTSVVVDQDRKYIVIAGNATSNGDVVWSL